MSETFIEKQVRSMQSRLDPSVDATAVHVQSVRTRGADERVRSGGRLRRAGTGQFHDVRQAGADQDASQ